MTFRKIINGASIPQGLITQYVENFKILSQTITDGINSNITLYTVPQNTIVSISSLNIINNTTVAKSYKLGIVKASDTGTSGISNIQTIIPLRNIDGNSVNEITGGITLSAGDQVRLYCPSSSLVVHIYGVEIS